MEKIDFENLPSTKTPLNPTNLNKMQDNIEESAVVVSPTEPTTNEKVWIRKSNNILSFKDFETKTINGITITNNKDGSLTLNGTSTAEVSTRISNVMNSLKAGKYTLIRNASGTADNYTLILYGKNETAINIHNNASGNTSQININTDYAEFYLWLYIGTGKTFSNYILKPQLEAGEVATAFAPYETEKTIFVKNANGVFEEFNVRKYSTKERIVGYWTDGRPIYEIVVSGRIPTCTTAGTSFSGEIITIANTKMRRIVDCWMENDLGDTYPMPWLSGTGQNGYLTKPIFNCNGTLEIQNANSVWSNQKIIAILQYTKTTD